MIRLEGIWKTYVIGEQTLHALQDVSEQIHGGEHVAIMGPSGSGKSTLLNILGCLDQPSRGEYFIDDQPVASLEQDELARVRMHSIGFIFQSFHLIPRLTAHANVTLPMMFAGVAVSERNERANAALEAVGLSQWQGHRPGELSGGQKQRVAIARAIVMRPRLLLADEPTGNLDSASGSQVLELLDELNSSGITLVTVTHDPDVAHRADRVLVLRDGAIVRRVAGSDVSSLAELFRTAPGEDAPASSESAPDAIDQAEPSS